MNIICTKDAQSAGKIAAKMVADEIRKKPDSVIAFPTGSSPIPCFNELADMHRNENLDFSKVYGFNMDEYIPLPKQHHQSCSYFLRKYLYSKVNISEERIFAPDATKEDLDQVCKEYTELIGKMGGFDLIILGIGRDGHITFNMPGPIGHVYTYIETLSPKTVKDNARFFAADEKVPEQAITLGLNLILNSKKVILLADGEAKCDAIADLLNHQEIRTELPASFLWLHNDVTIIVDEKAASKLHKS